MTSQQQTLPMLDLTAEEISQLPATLREKISAALGEDSKEPQQWVLVGAESVRQAMIMRKTMKTVSQIARLRRKALSENNIERLVDLYLEGEVHAEVEDDIELDNAELRARYLRETKVYTSADIRARSPKAKPKNPSEPASRWKREKRVFAIRYGASDLFPCFQFSDGIPLPVIKQILLKLPDHMTTWQIAFWFSSANSWLDGKTPEEALLDTDNVLHAAKLMCKTVIG